MMPIHFLCCLMIIQRQYVNGNSETERLLYFSCVVSIILLLSNLLSIRIYQIKNLAFAFIGFSNGGKNILRQVWNKTLQLLFVFKCHRLSSCNLIWQKNITCTHNKLLKCHKLSCTHIGYCKKLLWHWLDGFNHFLICFKMHAFSFKSRAHLS